MLSYIDYIYTEKQHYQNVPCKHLSTKTCHMLRLFIGYNTESYSYGNMKGIFKYKDGRIFEFTWRIHKPNQKYAHLSNQMTDIQEIIKVHDEILNIDYIKHRYVGFGTKAFWLYTPTKTLSDDDYDLRILMQTIKKWTVKEQLCKQFRKTDRMHVK